MASLQPFDVTMELGALPKQLLQEARGNPRLFRMAATAGILEAQSYTQGVLWAHTPRGTGLASTLAVFDSPLPYDKEPMGYIGWNAPAGRYLLFVELGTKPFRAPLAPLQMWAGRKFGSPAMAYRAWGAIAKRGIKPQRFVLAAAEEAQPIAGQIMLKRIIQYMNDWGRK